MDIYSLREKYRNVCAHVSDQRGTTVYIQNSYHIQMLLHLERL